MYLVVLIFAVLIISLSMSTVIMPGMLKSFLVILLQKKWLIPTVIFRVFFGVILVFSANECTFPNFIKTLGLILIIAGISLPIIGKNRIELLAQIFINQKDWVWRIAGFIGMLFGISLAMSGLPA